MSSKETYNPNDAFENMNRMYRYQRYFYDFTRKYYLLGRDKLIDRIQAKEGENILEIGCGTGRNLMILAKNFPRTNFFGLDASSAMLETARSKIAARNMKNIILKNALADDFNFRETFDLNAPFDSIYFSYSITMIPVWREAIQNALNNLKPEKKLYIVDFYDQRDLPAWFRWILQNWLKQFHVIYPKKLLPYLRDLEKRNVGELSIDSIYKSYTFIAEFKKG